MTTKGNGHLTEYIPQVNSWTGISGFLVVSMHRHRGKRCSELATGISTNKASGTDGVSATQAPFVMRARSANTQKKCYLQQEIMVVVWRRRCILLVFTPITNTAALHLQCTETFCESEQIQTRATTQKGSKSQRETENESNGTNRMYKTKTNKRLDMDLKSTKKKKMNLSATHGTQSPSPDLPKHTRRRKSKT